MARTFEYHLSTSRSGLEALCSLWVIRDSPTQEDSYPDRFVLVLSTRCCSILLTGRDRR